MRGARRAPGRRLLEVLRQMTWSARSWAAKGRPSAARREPAEGQARPAHHAACCSCRPRSSLPFWGKVQELRDAILDFRKSGKTVVAFLEYGGDREYYLASAADRVFLLPTSPLDLTGVASYEVFLRGTFDKLGAYPDFLHIGDYKTAVNQLTEKGFTPAHREMTESLNRDLYEQLVRGIAEARKKTRDEVRALLDRRARSRRRTRARRAGRRAAYDDQLDDRVAALKQRTATCDRVEGA